MDLDQISDLLVDKPLTVEQVQAAAIALGFTISVEQTDAPPERVPADPAVDAAVGSDVGSDVWDLRRTTLLLATLEAVVVRWQLDQDWRDPTGESLRRVIAQDAQAQVGASVAETLAAALRRVQTITGVVSGLPTSTRRGGPGCPNAILTQLLTAVGLLLSCSVTAHLAEADEIAEVEEVEDGAGHAAAGNVTISGEAVDLLAAQATRAVDRAAEALREWLADRQRPRSTN